MEKPYSFKASIGKEPDNARYSVSLPASSVATPLALSTFLHQTGFVRGGALLLAGVVRSDSRRPFGVPPPNRLCLSQRPSSLRRDGMMVMRKEFDKMKRTSFPLSFSPAKSRSDGQNFRGKNFIGSRAAHRVDDSRVD